MNYCIKELDDNLKPRERLKRYGPKSLNDYELLAIVLRCGTKNNNVINLAVDIINKYNGVNNLANAKISSLSNIKGIGEAKAITLLAALELGKRCLSKNNNKIKILDGKMVYDILKNDYINYYQEEFIVLLLDVKNNLINKEVIFKGSIAISEIHPREIFKCAIENSSSKIIVAHNHPTGDATPSKMDIEVTEKLIEIGSLIGIPVIDHVIIGNNNYYSYHEGKKVFVNE